MLLVAFRICIMSSGHWRFGAAWGASSIHIQPQFGRTPSRGGDSKFKEILTISGKLSEAILVVEFRSFGEASL